MQELRRANDDTVGAQAAVPAGGLRATLAEVMCGRLRTVAVVGDREGTTLTTGSVIGCGNMQELHTSNADKVETQATVLARALCALVAENPCVIGCGPLQGLVILSGRLST